MRPLPIAAVLVASLSSIRCGGGGGNASPVTRTLTSEGQLDGLVFATGGTTLGSNISMGDYADNLGPAGGMRGFVSFDVSGIPPGATILSATMTLTQRAVIADPYATLGDIVADHVVYGNILESGAYSRSFPTNQGFATLSSDATLGPRTLVVTPLVQEDVTGAGGHTQYRFRFETEEDLDSDSDQAQFFSAETATTTAELPTLVVTYLP